MYKITKKKYKITNSKFHYIKIHVIFKEKEYDEVSKIYIKKDVEYS